MLVCQASNDRVAFDKHFRSRLKEETARFVSFNSRYTFVQKVRCLVHASYS